jgi:ABC-2 type transport system permease protein
MNTMNALVASELLKLRTTRTGAWLVLGLVAVVALAVLAPATLVGRKHDPHTIVEGAATVALTLLLLLGIVMGAGDEQHGGVVSSLLVAPHRARLVGAKVVAGGLVGVACALLTAMLSLGLELLLHPDGHGLSGAEALLTATGMVAAGPLFAVLGLGVGIVLRSQALAIGVSLLWLYAGEQLVSQVAYPASLWLPGGARAALLRHVSATHHIPPMWVGGLLLAAYGFGACGAAVFVLQRRDLT